MKLTGQNFSSMKNVKEKYKAVGVMSGTSLDGIDVVLVSFTNSENNWKYEIEKSETFLYTKDWKEKLSNAQNLSAIDFVALHREYGALTGDLITKFLKNEEQIDFVASHGHTVFHKPEQDTTFQIGCGAYMAAHCKQTVISDFRTLDIALSGQGAPLVPIGDELLFSEYDACINLGGFANISFKSKNNVRLAYDICPVNIVTNRLVEKSFDIPYDNEGKIGEGGFVNKELLTELNQLDFYNTEGPKSLAREWVEDHIDVILNKYERLNPPDVICTFYNHIAQQIAKVINENGFSKVLFSGGGTYNNYLMNLIKLNTKAEIVKPDNVTIDFKEALIFGLLGLLRYLEIDNCLKSVTGAKSNNIGGCIYLP